MCLFAVAQEFISTDRLRWASHRLDPGYEGRRTTTAARRFGRRTCRVQAVSLERSRGGATRHGRFVPGSTARAAIERGRRELRLHLPT
jgi:hypothetical protein